MHHRALSDIAESEGSIFILALSLFSTIPYFLLPTYLIFIKVPEIQAKLPLLINCGIRNIASYQVITILAYTNIDFTDVSLKLLKSMQYWVFVDYLDDISLDWVNQEDYGIDISDFKGEDV